MSRAFRLGLFIVSTLTMLAIGVFLIGSRQFLFSSTYRVTTTFKSVVGLNEGAEVRVGGIHKGTVKRIDLPARPGGEMTVVMNLERSTNRVIRADSVASIQTEGLLGSKYVGITFGSDSAPMVEAGGSIPSEPPLDMADLVKKTSAILDSTKETMSDVQAIASKIDQGQGTVGALVNDQTVYRQLNDATAQAKLGAAAFQENMQALKGNFFLRGFFNKRGYDDATKLTEHEIAQLPKAPPLRTFRYDAGKIFDDLNTARLKNEKTLNDAWSFLEGNGFGLAVIVASGGMKGDTAEVRTLMQARAMVVRDYLVTNFRTDDTRIKTMGVGKSQQTSTDAGTVEVMVYPPTVKAGPSPASMSSSKR